MSGQGWAVLAIAALAALGLGWKFLGKGSSCCGGCGGGSCKQDGKADR